MPLGRPPGRPATGLAGGCGYAGELRSSSTELRPPKDCARKKDLLRHSPPHPPCAASSSRCWPPRCWPPASCSPLSPQLPSFAPRRRASAVRCPPRKTRGVPPVPVPRALARPLPPAPARHTPPHAGPLPALDISADIARATAPPAPSQLSLACCHVRSGAPRSEEGNQEARAQPAAQVAPFRPLPHAAVVPVAP